MEKITKELLIVTLGVFIAMLMNSWNDRRQDRHEAQQYLDGIEEEMKTWIPIFESWTYYEREYLKALKATTETLKSP
ncbi:MAG: hypothetical protein AAGG75_08525 [Bacteroidota bacterium]